MNNANVSHQSKDDDIQINTFLIVPLTNELSKGQVAGDASQIDESGEIDVLKEGQTIIEARVSNHKVYEKDGKAHRVVNGRDVVIGKAKKVNEAEKDR